MRRTIRKRRWEITAHNQTKPTGFKEDNSRIKSAPWLHPTGKTASGLVYLSAHRAGAPPACAGTYLGDY
jgi:hypothetical protein